MYKAFCESDEWLVEQYWGKRLSVDQIAFKFGYERSAIFRAMRKREIPRRGIRTARLISNEDKPYRKESWLRKQYLRKKLSIDRIAEICGTCSKTISDYLEKYGIQRRSKEEVDKLRRKTWLKIRYGSYWARILLFCKDITKSYRKYFKGKIR